MNKKIIILSIIILTMIIGIISVYVGSTYSVSVGPVTEPQPSLESLVDKIKSLAPTDSVGWSAGDEGLYKDENDEYRYIGANPDNWVRFNDDDYRIIGIFGENTHGLEGYRVKLIRAKSLGNYSRGIYNTDKTNGTYSGYTSAGDWTGSQHSSPTNLYLLLNEFFYNATDTSNEYGACEDWTYYYRGNDYKTGNCTKIKNYGIKEDYRGYIEDQATWFTGGISTGNYTKLTKQTMYQCERTGLEQQLWNCNPNNIKKTLAPIGLMYPSDNLYASGYFTNVDETQLSSFLYEINNWLFYSNEYSISSNSNTCYVIAKPGNIKSIDDEWCYYSHSIRPVFYLKPDVYVTGGTGAYNDPYIISMN